MRSQILVLTLTLLAASQTLGGEEPAINTKNWRMHPRIVAIRVLYTENQKLRNENKLKAEHKEYDCDTPGESERTVLRDEIGHIRVYLLRAGSEDSAYTAEHHYDSQGRLRFLFVTAGAVNESSLEMRLYFDDRGKFLWRDRKLVAGPGYPFVDPWPEELIVRDAEKAFRAPPREGCTPQKK